MCKTHVLMLCASTGPKMFWAGSNILCQIKSWSAFSATPKKFVPGLKLNANHLLVWHTLFGTGIKILGLAQYLDKFWSDSKNLDYLAQTTLGPVEGQGISLLLQTNILIISTSAYVWINKIFLWKALG